MFRVWEEVERLNKFSFGDCEFERFFSYTCEFVNIYFIAKLSQSMTIREFLKKETEEVYSRGWSPSIFQRFSYFFFFFFFYYYELFYLSKF